ncbi:TetR/AcrR family transcriptional regulator [Hyphococcus flavus]|uniref:TetR/AcrR family transcriptional regulator n=1 Tax=Hyphococcus flavus TaxID=1866326 RepID=A0AAE9ZBW5_9PROT|nr:TetR/AcrR family transcriptional regulator [Hyphococcus flavus]WDI31426.1 TetR/AcrR family transcriptional regulator [Hyphococcus flavus]
MAPSTDKSGTTPKKEGSSGAGVTTGSVKAAHDAIAYSSHLHECLKDRPTIRMSDGKPGRTRETIKRIIEAALKTFTRDGHAGLTLRNVADEAGIAVGNLTYHFPTKTALIEAMLREALADYVEDHFATINGDHNSPLEILMSVVEFYVRNSRSDYRFFFQVWGYAASDDQARRLVHSLYRPIAQFVYYLVRAANPELNHMQIRRAVAQISALEEGMKLLIGLEPEENDLFATAEEDLQALTKAIIRLA